MSLIASVLLSLTLPILKIEVNHDERLPHFPEQLRRQTQCRTIGGQNSQWSVHHSLGVANWRHLPSDPCPSSYTSQFQDRSSLLTIRVAKTPYGRTQ